MPSKQRKDSNEKKAWKIPWKEIFLILLGVIATETVHLVVTQMTKERMTLRAIYLALPMDTEGNLKGSRQYLLLDNNSDKPLEDVSVFSANPHTQLQSASILHPAGLQFSMNAQSGMLTIPKLRPRETAIFKLVALRSSLTFFDGDLRVVSSKAINVEFFKPTQALSLIHLYDPGSDLNLGTSSEEILEHSWVEPLQVGSLP